MSNEKIECKHLNGHPEWKFYRCDDCGAIQTDSGWGIASNKWFANEALAKFYQKNGYMPS